MEEYDWIILALMAGLLVLALVSLAMLWKEERRLKRAEREMMAEIDEQIAMSGHVMGDNT